MTAHRHIPCVLHRGSHHPVHIPRQQERTYSCSWTAAMHSNGVTKTLMTLCDALGDIPCLLVAAPSSSRCRSSQDVIKEVWGFVLHFVHMGCRLGNLLAISLLFSHVSAASWADSQVLLIDQSSLFLWLNDWDYVTRHSAHQHQLAAAAFLSFFFFFLRNKLLRTVVQHNALLSIMSIRCPHMLVARGYFNYIFSINSRVLCMHSLNEVPDSQISILNTTT